MLHKVYNISWPCQMWAQFRLWYITCASHRSPSGAIPVDSARMCVVSWIATHDDATAMGHCIQYLPTGLAHLGKTTANCTEGSSGSPRRLLSKHWLERTVITLRVPNMLWADPMTCKQHKEDGVRYAHPHSCKQHSTLPSHRHAERRCTVLSDASTCKHRVASAQSDRSLQQWHGRRWRSDASAIVTDVWHEQHAVPWHISETSAKDCTSW